MARLNEAGMVPAVEEVAVQVEEKPVEEVVPSNVYTLSTGVRVQLSGPLANSFVQPTITHTFVDANLDASGKVRQGDGDGDTIAQAAAMLRYNGALLSALNRNFLPAVTLYDGLPEDKLWLKALRRNPMVTHLHKDISWSDEEDLAFMYMLYIAFQTDTDWALLSTHLLEGE